MCSADWDLILEYLKALLAWPPLAFIFGIILIIRFRQELSVLILRLKKAPGFDFSQVGQDPVENTPPAPAASAAPGPLSDLEVKALSWEFRYLNYFLAPGTQAVLDWFCVSGPTTLQGYEAVWAPQIALKHERSAILQALMGHQLIEMAPDGTIASTAKGRVYKDWPGRTWMHPTRPITH